MKKNVVRCFYWFTLRKTKNKWNNNIIYWCPFFCLYE